MLDRLVASASSYSGDVDALFVLVSVLVGVWFIAVDADTNGTLNATFFDYVVTVIRP